LDAYAAVGKVLGTAKADVLMVDPYADEKAVTEYALLVPDNVTVRLVADTADPGCSLIPGLGSSSLFSSGRPCRVQGSLRGRGAPSA
jgi:hypothetical protein